MKIQIFPSNNRHPYPKKGLEMNQMSMAINKTKENNECKSEEIAKAISH